MPSTTKMCVLTNYNCENVNNAVEYRNILLLKADIASGELGCAPQTI